MRVVNGQGTIKRFVFASMGCPCELHLETADAVLAESAATRARAEVDRLDRKYSHYRRDSLVARIGACADVGVAIEVDVETANLLDFADRLYRESAGMFDITAGALTHLWDLRSARVPGHAEIELTRRCCGWHRVHWQRPRLDPGVPGMRLDLGGVVKEYAADRAAMLCREAGISSGLVDLGGDISVIGGHLDGSPWLAGITAPRGRRQAIADIGLAAGALATSGDYERVMIVDGRRYSHIIDPLSGYPVESFASVSVVADSCLVAGAAATTGMLLGLKAGVHWLHTLGLPYLCIDAAGNITGTMRGMSAKPEPGRQPILRQAAL